MKKLLIALSVLVVSAVLAHRDAAAATRDCGNVLECMFGSAFSSTRSTVAWSPARKYRPGSIIVRTGERALYYTLPDGEAIRYKVGVGRQGFTWSGTARVSRKAEWPTWTPPASMREREKKNGRILPVTMPGGPNNPLGARALYIGSSLYRIHGTNNRSSIGRAMSSGCIRMMNHDVVDLYNRVKLGARVYVQH